MKQKLNSQYLIFKISDKFFGVETKYIREIVENTESFPIPLETPHIKKIFIHRNEIIAILNTMYFFSLETKKDGFLIVFQDMIALPADELGGIFNLEQFDMDNKQVESPFIKKIFYTNDKPIAIIDYEELKAHEGKTILFPI